MPERKHVEEPHESRVIAAMQLTFEAPKKPELLSATPKKGEGEEPVPLSFSSADELLQHVHPEFEIKLKSLDGGRTTGKFVITTMGGFDEQTFSEENETLQLQKLTGSDVHQIQQRMDDPYLRADLSDEGVFAVFKEHVIAEADKWNSDESAHQH